MADAGHTSSDIARQTAAATAETVRHLGDTASEAARAGSRQVAGVQQKFTQNAARDFDQSVSRIAEVLQEMAPDWRALVQLPGVGGGKLQDLAVTMSGALERVMEVNLSAAEQLFRMSGPVAMLELQQRFTQQYLHALLEGSTAIIRAVRQSAEQTLEPLEQRMSEREQQQRRNGGERETSERVADVMVRDVKLVSPEDNVRQVAQMMREADTGLLPVTEGDRLIGMLTDRDVAVRLVAEGRDPSQTKVRDVMTADVRYVFEDEELEHVAENMAEQQVRRLPVMNRQKRLVGVVSLGDIAKRRERLAGKALSGISSQGGQHSQMAAE
ncbi:MAG TPA: CBS domain-containing protein [Acetobacteraceae bacterium]|nr:CBS domain-containing protein [Acetobacteraceae bacterium]